MWSRKDTNRTSFKEWSRRYKLVAGAKDEHFKAVLEWVEARETNAPTIAPEASGWQAPGDSRSTSMPAYS